LPNIVCPTLMEGYLICFLSYCIDKKIHNSSSAHK
jgi:hypothetical protein